MEVYKRNLKNGYTYIVIYEITTKMVTFFCSERELKFNPPTVKHKSKKVVFYFRQSEYLIHQ